MRRSQTQPSLEELRMRAALSLEEFASLFGKCKNWSYHLVWSGKIKVIKPLGEMMIPQSEVERLCSQVEEVTEPNHRAKLNGKEKRPSSLLQRKIK